MEDTCRTYYRTFVHKSIGRYDSIGATCHRESDKKCTVGDFVSSIILGHLPRAEAESHRLSSAPRPLFSSTSFSSLHITKGTCSPWQRVNSATAPASVYDRSLCPHLLSFCGAGVRYPKYAFMSCAGRLSGRATRLNTQVAYLLDVRDRWQNQQ